MHTGGMRGAQPSMFMQDMLSMPMMPPVEVGQLPPLEPPQSPFAFGTTAPVVYSLKIAT